MRRRPVVRAGDLSINPLALEAARLLVASYEFFDHWRTTPANGGGTVDLTGRRDGEWSGLPGGWEHVALGWQNVQLMLAWRDLSADRGELTPDDLLRLTIENRPTPRLVVAVVPGTNEWGDWTAGNLSFMPLKIGGLPGRWRRGFTLPGEWVWSELRRVIRPGDQWGVFGHSFGAAAGTIAAAHAIRDRMASSCAGVMAFASPRVGSRRAAEALTRAYPGVTGQRFVHGFDIVPWAVLPLGWAHSLSPVFIGHNGEVTSDYRFFREMWAALRSPGVQAIRDHGMTSYLRWAASLTE